MFVNIRLSSILGLAALSKVCAGIALSPAQRCQGTTVRTNMIGMNNDVVVETVLCESGHDLLMTQPGNNDPNNVCGAKCNTNCFHPAGGGPDPNHCQVIADALLFLAESAGELLRVPKGSQAAFVLKYRSCEAFIQNQANNDLTYCKSSLAGVIGFLAFNCQSNQDAHGGNCVADDNRWFVQVQSRT